MQLNYTHSTLSATLHFKKEFLQILRTCKNLSSKLQPVGGAAGLVVLQVDGAPTGGWRQIDLVLHQGFFVFGHPVAQDVGVVSRDYGHLCGERLRVSYGTAKHCARFCQKTNKTKQNHGLQGFQLQRFCVKVAVLEAQWRKILGGDSTPKK